MNKPRRSRKAISQRRAQRGPTAAPGPGYTPPAPRRPVRSTAPARPLWYRNPLYLGAAGLALLALLAGAAYLFLQNPPRPAGSGASSAASPAAGAPTSPSKVEASPAAPATKIEPSPAAAASPGGQKMQYSKYPDMVIDPNKTYKAVIETDKGDLALDLFAKDAPKTVNSFVFLARQGFYDNVPFHRVIEGFMAQGGDPTGTGRGGPGYAFEDEFNQNKIGEGALAMANAGPNTNGSQFFITYAPQSYLDGKHTVFGQLTAGMDVLKSLNKVEPGTRPGTPSLIKTIRITES